jgi:diguanylate cyclase (GGDEF)-like protein/PAS domain S-box-containing protein
MADEAQRSAGVAFRRRSRNPDPTLGRHLGRVATVFDAAPIGVGIWSVDGELLHANPVLCDLVQQSRDELLGQRFENFIEPGQASDVRQFVEDVWSGERNYFACEFRCGQIEGVDQWMRTNLTAIYGAGGRPAYLLSQIFEFTSSRIGEDPADRMANDAPAMLWLTDERGIPRVGNRRSFEFLGESPRTGDLGRGLFDRTHPGDYVAVAAQLRDRVPARMPLDFVARSRRRDGEWRWLHHRAEPIYAHDGTFAGYAGTSTDVTEQEDLRRDLAETRGLFRSITEAGPVAVATVDRRGRITYVNSRWADLVPEPEVRLLGDAWQRLVSPDEVRRLADRARASVESDEPFTARVTATTTDAFVLDAPFDVPGTRLWAELRVVPVFDEAGRHDGWVATLTDVSAAIAADSRADRLARVLDAGSDFLVIADRTGAITYVNNAAQQVLGVTGPDDLAPDAAPDFFTDVLDPDSFELFHEQVEPILAEEGIWRGELVLRAASGQDISVSALVLAHQNETGRIESISAVARDISDLKVAQRQLHELATHDYLTGMPNRVLLYDRLEQALARFHRYRQPVALLYLDLDRFKPVNDRYGHHVGDQVLQRIADRINGVIRETDTGARVGGDEFCVLVEGVDDPDLLRRVADRLIEVVSEPVPVEGGTARLGVSIGMVSVDESCADADALMALADAAMYRAKAAGRGRCVVHDPGAGQ